MPLRVVFPKFLGVAECRAGQQVQPPHPRSDQALDMAAKMRLTWRPPFDRDASILASSLEGPAAEVRAVVHVQRVWQAGDGPGFLDFALSQPCGFVEDGVQKAKADREPGRRFHREV